MLIEAKTNGSRCEHKIQNTKTKRIGCQKSECLGDSSLVKSECMYCIHNNKRITSLYYKQQVKVWHWLEWQWVVRSAVTIVHPSQHDWWPQGVVQSRGRTSRVIIISEVRRRWMELEPKQEPGLPGLVGRSEWLGKPAELSVSVWKVVIGEWDVALNQSTHLRLVLQGIHCDPKT